MASTENQPKTSSVYYNADDALVLAMELPGSVFLPMVFKAAIELDLLEIIARAGPDAQLSASVIASQLQTQNPDAAEMIDRMMRLLASYSILTFSLLTHHDGRVERLYGLAPVSTYFLASHDAPYTSFLKALNHKAFLHSWHHLKDAVLEGGTPFDKANGISVCDYAATDPSFSEPFNTAMLKRTTNTMSAILKKYKGFDNGKVVVDVGGRSGAALELITSNYPNIKGINFDLPHVIQNAPTYPGVQHFGGDMFVSVPTGDIILLKAVLHNWGNDLCLKLLKNCYEALPNHGKVVVIERILPLAPETTVDAKAVFELDLFMLAQHPGGKQRTEKEFENLAKGAGFIGFKLVCCAFSQWVVIEFYKSCIELPEVPIMASTENQPKTSSLYYNADDAHVLAMELPGSVVLPMVFKVAVELDLLEIIARAGPDAQLSPSVIASQLQTQNPDAAEMIDRIMRLLASYSILTCSLVTHGDGSIERLYGLAPVSTYFLANHDAPMASYLKMINHKVFLLSW